MFYLTNEEFHTLLMRHYQKCDPELSFKMTKNDLKNSFE